MRARNLKPGTFKNELLAVADPLYTVIFAGLWCLADREGRLEDRPSKIHLEVNPGRAYERTIESIDWLAANNFIQRYEARGCKFIQVINFHKHQNPHQREVPSEIPPPPGLLNKYADEPISPEQRKRIFARDNGQCIWCGSKDDLHVDHVQPRSRGGTSEDTNLQTLCGTCNVSKGIKAQPRHTQSISKDMHSPEKAMPSPADSLFLDSPSLIPDSGYLIPDSCSSGTDVEQEFDGSVERVFDHWRRVMEHPRAQLDPKRRKVIRGALKAYPEADLCEAISGYLNSPHHMGENDRNTRYTAIELLLRDAAHVDAGLQFARAPPTAHSSVTDHNVRALTQWLNGDATNRQTTVHAANGTDGGGFLEEDHPAVHRALLARASEPEH